jgi:hypothetical protein
MVSGLSLLDEVEQVCNGCMVKKQHRTSFLAEAKRWAQSILDLIRGDLSVPIILITRVVTNISC